MWISAVLLAVLVKLVELQTLQPPNIVFILADDLGWNDVGFHGSNEVSTPNLDALAYSGVILKSHYSESLCTPSRASLLTGRYPIHTGTQHNVILEASPWGLPLTETLLPQYLTPLGYESHAVGKWHLGFYQKNYTPTYRGFKSHYGLWNGFHDYYSHYTQASFSPFEGYDLRRDMEVDWDGSGRYTTRLLSQEAERIISSHNTTKPLFLYMAHLAVHAGSWERPLQAPQAAIRRFSTKMSLKRRTYLGMLWELDQSVGRLVKSLEDRGILDNTIIIFCSDNGAATRGLHKNTGSNYPLRGEKGTPWEGGLRTASFIWSRKLKQKAKVLNGLIHISDWLPTLYTAAGGNARDLDKVDGVSQWDYINGDVNSPRKEILHNIDDIYRYSAIRIGNYKYINGTTLYGFLDDWVGLVEDPNISYDHKSVINSEAGIITGITSQQIMTLRSQSLVTCSSNYPRVDVTKAWDDENYSNFEESHEKTTSWRQSSDLRSSVSQRSTTSWDGTSDKVRADQELTTEGIRRKRSSAIMMRSDVMARRMKRSICDPLIEPCLFNLLEDPCETNNLAKTLPQKVSEMERRLYEIRKTMVSPLNLRVESIANPALYNNTWTYWRDLIPPHLIPPKQHVTH